MIFIFLQINYNGRFTDTSCSNLLISIHTIDIVTSFITTSKSFFKKKRVNRKACISSKIPTDEKDYWAWVYSANSYYFNN